MQPTVSEKAVVASIHGSQEPALVSRTLDMVPIVAARAQGEAPSEFLVDEPTDNAELSDYKPLPPS
jgi:hypothetical protein